MDFNQLLYKAQENERNASGKEVRCYNTSFGAPKKLEKSKVSSENIQRFLKRKEDEEQRKLLEAKKKKDELLALRSQDKKAQKRVQVMLKRTKSANKSVMADAIDNVNTADTLAGPTQCDEDDYGYVSQEASAYYNKLMDKYQRMPVEKYIFSKGKKEVKDLNAAKDRVKAALQKEAEDEQLPHKRKKKKKEGEDGCDHESDKKVSDDDTKRKRDEFDRREERGSDSKKRDEKKKKFPPKALPPPVGFEQLLRIAEKKQFEPIVIEKPDVEKEPERLMTLKEKQEYLQEKERRNNRLNKHSTDKVTLPKIPLKNQSEVLPKIPIKGQSEKTKPAHPVKPSPQTPDKEKKSLMPEEKLKKSSSVWSKPCNLANRPKKPEPSKSIKPVETKTKPEVRPTPSQETPPEKRPKLNGSALARKSEEVKPKVAPSKKLDSVPPSDELSDIDREIELLKRKRELLAKAKHTAAQEVKIPDPKPSVPVYIPTPVKELAARREAMRPTTGQKLKEPPRLKGSHELKKVRQKKRRLDSESEDSDLDGFIDDSVDGELDYSKHIREIFGYDRSKYKDIADDDDECMVSNFAQISREEYVSTKCGIMEDLEDIRKEQEEKARKKLKMTRR